MAKRITYAKIKSMDASEISKLSHMEAADMLRQFREKFQFRQRAFSRAGKNVYSPALDKMESYYERNKVQPPESMNINRIRSELFHIQEFFNAKTGDVKGAREVMREQDARIFGTTKSGRPRFRMTIDERRKFWSVYEEFLRTYKNYETKYGSNKIMQYLGDMTVEDRKKAGTSNLMEKMNDLQERLREAGDYNADMRNVRQGR